jgi:hypothetical protein
MRRRREWAPGLGVEVSGLERIEGGWAVSATMNDYGRCPACDTRSSRRHGWYIRRLQDMPAQGVAVGVRLKLARWKCTNPDCARRTFCDRLPAVAQPYARRTRRVVDLARLVTHTTDGRPAGRLMTRLELPQSRDALLRALKRGMRHRADDVAVRGSASMTGAGGRAQPTGRSWWTCSVARLSISCRIAQLIRPPAGLGGVWRLN